MPTMMMMIYPFVFIKKKKIVNEKERKKKRKFSINHMNHDEVFLDESLNFPSSSKSKSSLSSLSIPNKCNNNLEADSNDLETEQLDNFLSMLHPSILESLSSYSLSSFSE